MVCVPGNWRQIWRVDAPGRPHRRPPGRRRPRVARGRPPHRLRLRPVPAVGERQRRHGGRARPDPVGDPRSRARAAAVSSAAWIGVAADPVLPREGRPSFQTNALTGSLDDEFYRQDKVTVLAGKLPPPDAANEIMLTQSEADALPAAIRGAVPVGDRMTWQLFAGSDLGAPPESRAGHLPDRRDRDLSPALVDGYDDIAAALLPPAATSASSASPRAKAMSGHSAGRRCGCATVTPTCPRCGPGSPAQRQAAEGRSASRHPHDPPARRPSSTRPSRRSSRRRWPSPCSAAWRRSRSSS